jgi:hypothetical protein
VLFFPWLNSSKSAVEKYRNLYHKYGLDVLEIKAELKHFMWPSYGVQLALDALNIAHAEKELSRDKYIVHAMSIGAFIYTMVLVNCMKNSEYSALPDKIIGQVFDSIVIGGLPKMESGIGISASDSKILQNFVSSLARLYFSLTKKHTVDFYMEAVDNFHKLPPKSPSLVFYSHNDPMCDVDSMRHLLDVWKTNGFPLVEKSWPVSAHAGHLRNHTEDYLSLHIKFMKEILGKE